MYLNQNFIDFQSLTKLKEIKIQNSKILTMNPETFKALNLSLNNVNIKSNRASFQDVTSYHNNTSADLNKNKVYQGLRDLKKLALDINEMITINNENQVVDNNTESAMNKCLEKINAHEKRFQMELNTIETKLTDMSANFENRFDLTLEKMHSNELKLNQFKADVKEELVKIEKKLEKNIDTKLNEINVNFEKQFDDFSSKLEKSFQEFFSVLKRDTKKTD
jgi:hypothetical protein